MHLIEVGVKKCLKLIERDGQWYVRFIDVGFWQLVLKIVNKVKEI